MNGIVRICLVVEMYVTTYVHVKNVGVEKFMSLGRAAKNNASFLWWLLIIMSAWMKNFFDKSLSTDIIHGNDWFLARHVPHSNLTIYDCLRQYILSNESERTSTLEKNELKPHTLRSVYGGNW